MNQNMKLYGLIEAKMVAKLLTLERLNGKDVRVICHNLVGLPKITQQILILISKLYPKVQKLTDFRPLFMVFQANFTNNPEAADIEALFRICVPETLGMFKELLQTRLDLRAVIL